MRKTNYKYWRKLCDKKIQELVLEGEPKCFSCGKKAEVGHHFFPVSIASGLRYDLKNCIPLCKICHFQHHSKYDPSIHARIIYKLGKEWYEDLLSKKRTQKVVGINASYYKKVYKQLNGDE